MITILDLNEVNDKTLQNYSDEELLDMLNTCEQLQEHEPFNILTIFDAFFCSPVHMDKMRSNYRLIMHDLSQSNLMQSILRDVTDNPGLIFEKTEDFSREILASEYSLS